MVSTTVVVRLMRVAVLPVLVAY